ncbi:DMT family transporter [Peptostreptococcus faecalis]|uniref:DMT family transporter n=1 Tax=Peptostreptococcus faecalis TaxID=2045015 RepID=UPI000C7BF996|nr:multidrug efflux SMR transporter [Peptostreptococcus faecalis]
MIWFVLILAGIFEMLGVLTISNFNKTRNIKNFLLLVVAFTFSFTFLYIAMKSLPTSIAYSVWTGIGASGGALLGILLFNEPKNKFRITFICLIILSVVGLKIVG